MSTTASEDCLPQNRTLQRQNLYNVGLTNIFVGAAVLNLVPGIFVFLKFGLQSGQACVIVLGGFTVVAFHFALYKIHAWFFTAGLVLIGLGGIWWVIQFNNQIYTTAVALVAIGAVMFLSGWRNIVIATRPYNG